MLCQNLDMLDIVHAKDTNTAIFSFPWNREFAGQFDFLCKKEEITANMKKIFSGLPFHVIIKLHMYHWIQKQIGELPSWCRWHGADSKLQQSQQVVDMRTACPHQSEGA